MSQEPTRERIVTVHQAGTATEAVVIRSLLESAGISSPGFVSAEPFPMREPPEGFLDTDIVVLESQADDARRIIGEFLNSSESVQIEETAAPDEPENPA